MEVVEHWDDLLAYLVENRERIDVTGHSYISVEQVLAADKTLSARFALLASVINVNKCFIVELPWFGGWFDQALGNCINNEVLRSC